MDGSTEGAAQDSVLKIELFSAESVVINGKRLFAETSNIGIRDKGYWGIRRSRLN
jgi:hypothetical protein